MRRLFVTGANGFTGVHLVQAAARAGYEVFESNHSLEDTDGLTRAVETFEPTHAVHLAAISAVTHADESALYRVNTLGTQTVLKALLAASSTLQKVVVASSANVYGNARHSPISEQAELAPVNHYAISKLGAEYVAKTFLDRLPIVIARPFNYTGVGHDTRFVVPKIVQAFARKDAVLELGNLQVEREFNDVRFVVASYLALLSAAQPGQIYNLCTGNAVSLTTVLEEAQRLTGHAPKVIVNPQFVRNNEIARLCGSQGKLFALNASLPQYCLADTLAWMLS
jgi:GDP-6-deoxy-D-talose 4-dehydrogenase